MTILQDIKTAVKMTGQIRKARKAGADAVQIKPVYTIPCITLGPAYYNTMEGCLMHRLGRKADCAVKEVFKNLPYETKRRLEFTPEKPGKWVERAHFWAGELEPVLPSGMYHKVMALFTGWYAHCLRMRKEAKA